MSNSLSLVQMGERVLQHNAVPYRITMGNHAKFHLTHHGKSAIICTALTTSDHRAAQNFYHQLRRSMTKIGCTVKKDSKRLIHN